MKILLFSLAWKVVFAVLGGKEIYTEWVNYMQSIRFNISFFWVSTVPCHSPAGLRQVENAEPTRKSLST